MNTALIVFVIATLLIPTDIILVRIYQTLCEIRDELRLIRTGGVSFEPPRRGR